MRTLPLDSTCENVYYTHKIDYMHNISLSSVQGFCILLLTCELSWPDNTLKFISFSHFYLNLHLLKMVRANVHFCVVILHFSTFQKVVKSQSYQGLRRFHKFCPRLSFGGPRYPMVIFQRSLLHQQLSISSLYILVSIKYREHPQ